MTAAALLLGLALMFSMAGAAKLFDPGPALDVVAGWLPGDGRLDRLVVLALGGGELAVGAAIAAGGRLARAGSRAAIGLLCLFAVAVFALAWEGSSPSCGCGLPLPLPGRPGVLHIFVDGLLALVALQGVRVPEVPRTRVASWARAAVVACVLGASLAWGGAPARRAAPEAGPRERPSLAAQRVSLDGETVPLASLRPTLVLYYLPDCWVCRRLRPAWERLAGRERAAGGRPVAVALAPPDSSPAARADADAVLVAPSDACAALGVCRVPEVWVVGADGVARERLGPGALAARAPPDDGP